MPDRLIDDILSGRFRWWDHPHNLRIRHLPEGYKVLQTKLEEGRYDDGTRYVSYTASEDQLDRAGYYIDTNLNGDRSRLMRDSLYGPFKTEAEAKTWASNMSILSDTFISNPQFWWHKKGDDPGFWGGPVNETGYYVNPCCGVPGCCRPDGPFATEQEARKWEWEKFVPKLDQAAIEAVAADLAHWIQPNWEHLDDMLRAMAEAKRRVVAGEPLFGFLPKKLVLDSLSQEEAVLSLTKRIGEEASRSGHRAGSPCEAGRLVAVDEDGRISASANDRLSPDRRSWVGA